MVDGEVAVAQMPLHPLLKSCKGPMFGELHPLSSRF